MLLNDKEIQVTTFRLLLVATLLAIAGCAEPSPPQPNADAISRLDQHARRIQDLESQLSLEKERSRKLEEVRQVQWERILRIERVLGEALYREQSGGGGGTASPAEVPVRERGLTRGGIMEGGQLAPIAESPASNTSERSPLFGLSETTIIKQDCAKKWGTNYQMQEFCIGQQTEAAAKLRGPGPSDIPTTTFSTIRKECQSKWGTNFQMREFCEGQQTEAFRKIR